MGEEQLDLGLGEPVEAPSLRNDVADELVVPLARRLVRRPIGVGEERPDAPFLDLVETGEFGPVVAQVAFEGVGVVRPKQLAEGLELPKDGLGVALRYQIAELEPEFRVGYGQYRLPVRGLPLDRVVLPEVGFGMGFHEPPVVGVGPSEHPRDVDWLSLGIVVFVAEPDVSGQLVRLDAQIAGVDVPPDGAFAAYGLQGVVAFVDVVQGLPFEDPFRDDGIHFRDLLVGYAFVDPRLVPLPDGKRVRVDAVLGIR